MLNASGKIYVTVKISCLKTGLAPFLYLALTNNYTLLPHAAYFFRISYFIILWYLFLKDIFEYNLFFLQ